MILWYAAGAVFIVWNVFQSSGVDTVAPFFSRTLKGDAISWPSRFCRKSTYTLPPRFFTVRSTVEILGSAFTTVRASSSPRVTHWS